MAFILEHVKEEQHSRVKLPIALVGIFLWNRHISWEETVRKAGGTFACIADCIYLKSVPLFLVIYSKFVDMIAFKTDCLFITRQHFPQIPRLEKNPLHVRKEWVYLIIGVSTSWGDLL